MTVLARLLLVLIALCLGNVAPGRSENWRATLIAQLQHGDLVYRRGKSQVSATIASLSASATGDVTRWTHMGVAVRLRPGARIWILHAIEDRGVTLDPPEVFFASDQASSGAYQRFHDGPAVAQAALKYLGRPFDTAFDLHEHGRLYCSELVYLALEEVRPDVRVPLRDVPFVSLAVFPDDIERAVAQARL